MDWAPTQFMEWAATSENNNQGASVKTNRSVTVYPDCGWAAIIQGQYAEKDTDIEILMEDNSTQTIPWIAESAPNSTYARGHNQISYELIISN